MSILEFVMNGIAESGIKAVIEIDIMADGRFCFIVSTDQESHTVRTIGDVAPLLHRLAIKYNPKSKYAKKAAWDYNPNKSDKESRIS